MRSVKKLVITGLCVALGVLLPMAFHAIPKGGQIFLPMHIPVLICGLVCGWYCGLFCGILAPLLSFLLTGMPAAAVLPSTLCQMAVYGLVAGLMVQLIRTKSSYIDMLVAMLMAMITGRLVGGVLNALIFQAGAYSWQLWVSGMLVTGLAGIAIQIVLVPVVAYSLEKAKLVSRDEPLFTKKNPEKN